jgi:DnaJ-class molecular chaperone
MDRTDNSKPVIKSQSDVRFIPEKIAQRCPVCNGFGTLKWGQITCKSCGGKGYVLVPAKEDRSL